MRALIAMSGGVDSAVAAYLMKKNGYDCIGATMKLYNNEDIYTDKNKTCCSLDDVEDARNVAYRIGIPYYVFNFSDNFKKEVIDRFIKAYEQGSTPNPCIDCNRYIKWKKLFQRMKELECDYVVTGHYARIEKDKSSGRYLLKKGLDETKDQSYVLYNMTQDQLSHTILPLGGLHKTEVRAIAEENDFINARKSDSQDICFVPDGDYAKFIEEYSSKKYEHGDFVDTSGRILGEHKGIIRYTIGQRKGLGLSLKSPMYVCDKRIDDNTVVLGSNEELYSKSLLADDFNWISIEEPQDSIRVKAKTRYKQTEQWATVSVNEDSTVLVLFDEPQRAITKGQAVVLYDGDVVVGGGTII